MTPAINVAKKAKVTYKIHEYEHDPQAESYGKEAAEILGLAEGQVFKTLMVALGGNKNQLAVGVVPVANQLDLKAFASAVGVKKVAMADPKDAERVTGYLLGGISPLGQKKRLPTVIDESALAYDTIFVSAGRRGLEIELSPQDLQKLVQAKTSSIGR